MISSAQKSTTCLDCSTIDISAAKKIASLCEEKGIHFNDCPGLLNDFDWLIRVGYKLISIYKIVSGGVKGAENATLTFMVTN